MSTLNDILALSPVVPVVTIEDHELAEPLAEALLEGGIKTIEITLRTPAGLKAIEALAKLKTDIVVGAGTILTPDLLKQAMNAGAEFLVSPGLTPALAEAANKHQAPLLPGTSTPSEVMKAMEWGFTSLKFFPAESAGGVGMLKNFSAVFPKVTFCPTGGINLKNKMDYLALPNVICVGGSWLTPKDMLTNKDWAGITQLAREAMS